MLNVAKYATVAALAVSLGVVATKPASAWGDGYGYSRGPYAYGFAYPYGDYGYYGYRPFYRHHFYGFYGPRPFYRHWW